MIQKKRLLIYTHFGGRFANQLFVQAHFMAFLFEHPDDFDFINLSFTPYRRLLENTSKQPICIYPTHHKRWKSFRWMNYLLNIKLPKVSHIQKATTTRILYTFAKNLGISALLVGYINPPDLVGHRIDSLDLAYPNDIRLFYQANTTLVTGWGFRSWALVEKHQDKIREGLMFNSTYTQVAQKFIQNLRKQYDFLIGVLIRQGDYRGWSEGKYYFETEEYINWMKQAKEVFGATRNVAFVVASDDKQDSSKFQDLNVYFATGFAVGKGHYVENIAELSMCDIVMTPPSTFGVWAAFLGDIPVLPVGRTQVISENNLLKNHIFDALKHPYLSVSIK
ncbi:alpha-1,2-fucosyltransferase [Nostoc sp. UHCC 0702]|nr:alpha-1,2-fucosyltransferase [Nostoc sp. UHCC 0702]